MPRPIKHGSADQSVVIRIIDSTDGTPETGVAWNTSGIALWYRRDGGSKVDITEATLAAADSAHADGGFVAIADGYYRLDLPDAACASGSTGVAVGGTVTGMVVIGAYHPLVPWDPQDAARLGLTALPSSGTLAVNPTLAASQAFNNTGQTIPVLAALADDRLAGARAVAAAIRAVQTDRVDFFRAGDSTTIGYEAGLAECLSKIGQQYASPLFWGGEDAQAGVGYLCGIQYAAGTPGTGAPSQLAAYLDRGSGGLYPAGYSYYTAGVFLADAVVVDPGCPLGLAGPMTWEIHYGTFASGTHSFHPTIIHEAEPYTLIVDAGSVNATTGGYGMTRMDVALPADAARTRQLKFRTARLGVDGHADPFLLYHRVVRADRPAGWSTHVLDARNGQSMRLVAYDLQQATNTTLTYYFSQIRRLQGHTKRLVFVLNGSQNDATDSNTSVGPAAVASNTADGYFDNMLAIVQRITGLWRTNGWDPSELYWIFEPTHPKAASEAALVTQQREAARRLARFVPQSVAVDLSELTTYDELVAAGYLDTGDLAHPTASGYTELTRLRLYEVAKRGESLPTGGIATASFASGTRVPRVTLVDTTTDVTNVVDASVSPLASGTVASTTGTTTTLDSGAVATASYYLNARLVITTGTGAGQERLITAYSAGRVATHAAWTTNPTSSSTYEIQPARGVGRDISITNRSVAVADL
jgi:hypothetical protein